MYINYTFFGIFQWYEVIRIEQLIFSFVCIVNEVVKLVCKELQKEIDKIKKDFFIDVIKFFFMKL